MKKKKSYFVSAYVSIEGYVRDEKAKRNACSRQDEAYPYFLECVGQSNESVVFLIGDRDEKQERREEDAQGGHEECESR
jgi:hypothetical protein